MTTRTALNVPLACADCDSWITRDESTRYGGKCRCCVFIAGGDAALEKAELNPLFPFVELPDDL
jgi:hypothetical protein